MATEEDTTFDIQLVGNKFQASKHEDDDIKLQYYLEGYEELNK